MENATRDGPEDIKVPDSTASGRSRLRRHRRWRFALAAGLILVIPVLLVFSFLSRIVFPGQTTQGQNVADVTLPSGSELISLRSRNGQRVAALFGTALTDEGRPRPDASRRPTLLFFYGNAMCIATSTDLFEAFRRLGANVLVPDYLGYGLSGGRATETGCYATADACLDHLRHRPDVDPTRIVVSGWSLGGAVAIDLATRRSVAGLAIFSTFTSTADVARDHVPYLPAANLLLSGHRFASLDKMGRISCPVLIGHGTDDSLIPFGMMERLADATRGHVDLMPMPGAGHNDFFEMGGADLMDRLERFLNQPPRMENPSSTGHVP